MFTNIDAFVHSPGKCLSDFNILRHTSTKCEDLKASCFPHFDEVSFTSPGAFFFLTDGQLDVMAQRPCSRAT